MMKKQFALSLILILLLSGCSSLQGLLPTATASAGDIEGSQPTATSAAADAPTEPADGETPAGTPDVTTMPVSESVACVPPSEHPDFVFSTYEELPQTILDYLNGGASPEELAVSLIVQGLGPEDQPVWAEDLTGDGYREVVVTVYDPANQPQGALMIYNCQNGAYVLVHVIVSEVNAFAPVILHIQDINADGEREAVLSSTNCGAHTCFQDVKILAWENEHYTEKLEGSTLEYPYPDVKLTDYDHDGIYTLEVTGTAYGSVGAGPQRDTINSWTYDPTVRLWRLTDQTLAASPFRIHLVHDADAAMDREEYLIASLLYEQVINDDSLLEWAKEEVEYNNLAAYAAYKRVVAAVFMGDRPSAETIFTELKDQYGKSSQYGYVEMAEAFLTDSETLGAEGGCTAARQYAASHQTQVLDPLGSAVYGYANPDYTPEDICP
ncbi:MAG: hypothetical protein P8046_08235 [Anaerolineales bacterium]